MDYVIVVNVNRELSIERACKRSKKLSKDDIIKRLNLQYPICLKKMFADYIVDNNGNKEDLDIEIKKLYNKILNWSNQNENSNLSR